MSEMSQRKFALHMGVTLRAVQKAIASRRIALNENGKIDSDVAAAAWRRNTDEGRKSFSDLSRHSDVPAGAMPAADDDIDADLDDMPTSTGEPPPPPPSSAGAKEDAIQREYRTARAAREKTRHEREQLELDQMRGNLIPVSEAQRLAFTALRTVRDAIMNISVRVMDEFAAETEPSRIQLRLEEELANALHSINADAILSESEDDDSDGGD
ncbi:hypothetical protein [Pandoraea commovens]|uniref:Terminase small subunit n=1 Tax=Pandoraea commovens TaxID=2508289 RepID=A0ABY5QJY4_9BURK|nr:hypothetical protein [Pandoraea commovens]UVA80458.1 hypothetical protein NTU39_05395 [Pandoraea commovens]